MARTKAEIRAFLDGQVGTSSVHPGYPDLNGQCVTLTKALMAFLGVPSPYAARGNAITAGDAYIAQGLGRAGKGWLTIVVNRDMGYIGGVHYGHIWIDLMGEANYESNGARAVYTTKNTRPITQGQQFINFDQWVTEEGNVTMNDNAKKGIYRIGLHREPENDQVWRGISNDPEQALAKLGGSTEWLTQNHILKVAYPQAVAQLNDANRRITEVTTLLKKIQDEDVIDKQQLAQATKDLDSARKDAQTASDKAQKALDDYEALKKQSDMDVETGNSFLRWLGKLLNGGK